MSNGTTHKPGKLPGQRQYIINDKTSFVVQEAYKTLRTNIRFFLSGDEPVFHETVQNRVL